MRGSIQRKANLSGRQTDRQTEIRAKKEVTKKEIQLLRIDNLEKKKQHGKEERIWQTKNLFKKKKKKKKKKFERETFCDKVNIWGSGKDREKDKNKEMKKQSDKNVKINWKK